MINLTPHQSKALTTKGHLALTANAGSGKTFVLATKYLDTLLNNNVEVSNIAAITFTDKAASELYLKISILIDDELSKITDKQKIRLLKKLRRQLVSANISTIHSFCINILREFPVEAQLDARFLPIDENLSDELIELAIEETIKNIFDCNNSLLEQTKELIRIFGSKNRLHNQLYNLIKNRKNVFEVEQKIYTSEITEIANTFYRSFCNDFILIWNKNKKSFIKYFNDINNSILQIENTNQIALEVSYLLTQLNTFQEASEIISVLKKLKLIAFTEKNTLRLKGYLKKEITEQFSKEISDVQNLMNEFKDLDITPDHSLVENELAGFGKSLLSLFNIALGAYENKKKKSGYIDYEDILLHTRILLANNEVKNQLVHKYKFILIDEFQDTNEIQYQIFLPILDDLKSGNLFIVGDEKQSIYKFRDAEIEIFNLTRFEISSNSSSDNLLVLPDSFRMAPSICCFCNYLFQNLFAEADDFLGEVPAADLICARTDDTPGSVEFLLSQKNKTETILNEAELIARKIKQIVSEGKYSYKDITILVRKRKYFTELEKEFLLNDIPFVIVGGRGFYQRQTVSDLYNYLSFLVDENNSPALIGILRSPFINLSDSEIFEISLNKGYNFWKKFECVKHNPKYTNLYMLLNEHKSIYDSISLPQLIIKIITDSNYLSIIKSRIDGEQEIANINKLISLSRHFNATGFRNIYDFLEFLKQSIIGLTDESQASIVSDTAAVQLMTIHQSKGLEFPVVFVYKTNEPGLSDFVKSGEVKVDKKYGLLSKVPVNKNYLEEFRSAPIVTFHNYIESKKNNAELKRLLYVAFTRAKDKLIITATLDEKENIKIDSFLELIIKGLNTSFHSNPIRLKSKLEFLKFENNSYTNFSEVFDMNVPVIKSIEQIEQECKIEKTENLKPVKNIASIQSIEKQEIISASKVAIYHQCPLKYQLLYEYGFKGINTELLNYKRAPINGLKVLGDEEVIENLMIEKGDLSSSKKSNLEFDAAMYGKIFHKILEANSEIENIADFFRKFIPENLYHSDSVNELIQKIYIEVKNFKTSNIYKKINSYKNFNNELEIYIKENDYYLHGIVDKIAFNEKKLIIYDYKTDDIELSEIKKHSANYLMQLKFYLYIASKLFDEFEFFEGNLVFIKQPDNPVTINYNKKEIKILNSEINKIIMSIRNQNKSKNLEHCKDCTFSGFTKNCIIN